MPVSHRILLRRYASFFRTKSVIPLLVIAYLLNLAFYWFIWQHKNGGSESTLHNVPRQIITASSIDTKQGVKETESSPLSLPADGFPRALIVNACSGSSAIFEVTLRILEAHGYRVHHGGEPNLETRPYIMKEARRRFAEKISEVRNRREPSQDELYAEVFTIINEEAIKYDKILLFKIKSPGNGLLMQTLEKLGTKFAFSYRGELLHRAICSTRDCFRTGLGYQVYANGTKADTCFGRRQGSHEKLMAHFNDTEILIKMMTKWRKLDKGKEIGYKRVYHPANSTAYEDMFEFQYITSDKALNDAVKVWFGFLKNFGELKKPVIKRVLQKYKNFRSLPPPFNETIYNFDEKFRIIRDGDKTRYETGTVFKGEIHYYDGHIYYFQ